MKTFKLSKPLNQPSELRKAIKETRDADQLTEFAVMRAFDVFRVLKFAKTSNPSAELTRTEKKL